AGGASAPSPGSRPWGADGEPSSPGVHLSSTRVRPSAASPEATPPRALGGRARGGNVIGGRRCDRLSVRGTARPARNPLAGRRCAVLREGDVRDPGGHLPPHRPPVTLTHRAGPVPLVRGRG